MRIHLLSDLHNEFDVYHPEKVDADVVLLAGDIDIKARALDWAREAFDVPVLYCAGNHEYYKGHLQKTQLRMREASCDRVRFMECEELVLGGVRFLVATMWTDFTASGNVPLAVFQAKDTMNDFKHIRTEDYRRLRPDDMMLMSSKTRDWLRARLDTPFDGPTVVMTHHAPTLKSLDGSGRPASHLDAAYANRWEDLMGGDRVALWVHGHTHFPVDYDVAGTRVVSNPRGYPGEETGFDPAMVIEL